MSGVIARVDTWIFVPGDARRLGAVRGGFCLVLIYRLTRPVYVHLAHQPPALFRPMSFMKAFGSMPGPNVVLGLQVLGVGAAALALIGARARLTLPVAWTCALILGGMTTSTGKVVHNDVLVLLAMVPLLLPHDDGDGWPLRVAMIVVAGTYFLSGFQKVVNSGPGWVTSGNMRWVLYASSDAQAAPNAFALKLASAAWLTHLVSLFTLAVELGFPVVLWKPRTAWLWVPACVALHSGILVMMHLDYVTTWGATAVIVFTDWPGVLARLRARTNPPLAV